MGKHNNFRLDEEKVRNAFADFSPVPDEQQWSKLEQSLEILGVQRKNSLRQKIQRTAVFSGLILLGASLVAFINIKKHQTAGNENDLNAGEEVVMGDHFYSPSASLNMKRTVSEVKLRKVIVVDSANSVQSDSAKVSGIVSTNDKSISSTDSSASEVKKQATPTEPKKKKKRKKRKRKPASHNPSDDEVIIS